MSIARPASKKHWSEAADRAFPRQSGKLASHTANSRSLFAATTASNEIAITDRGSLTPSNTIWRN
jgi:hypothetical protein